MMPLLEGRINRKTFMIGSVVGLMVFAVIGIFIVPIALIDILVNQSHSVDFTLVYYIFLLPAAAIYAFYFAVLAIKRAHDIGLPGVPLLITFVLAEGVSRLTGWWGPHLLVLAILLLLVIAPTQRRANKFGPRPPKRFRLRNLRLDT